MKQFRLFILAFVFLWGVVHQELAFAAAGKFLFVNGDVAVVETSGKQHKGQKGDELNEGDSVVTSANGFAQIKMEDGGAISVRPDTNFKINKFQYSGKEDGSEKSHFSLSKGSIRSVTGAIGKKHRENYKIETATATIGVRGSGADVGHADSIGTAVHTLFGGHSISTNLDGKTLTLETKPGQTALVAPGSAPQFVPSFPFSTAVAPPSKGEEKGSDSKQKSGDAKEEKSSKDEKSSKEQKSSDAKDSKKEESKSSDSQNKNSESKSASDSKSDSSAGSSQSTSSESTSSGTNSSSSTSTSQSSSTSQQTTSPASSATSSQSSSMQTAAPTTTASLTTSSALNSTGGGLSATSMTISPVAQIAAPVVPVVTEIKTTTDIALTSVAEVATAVNLVATTATATATATNLSQNFSAIPLGQANALAQFSVIHAPPASLLQSNFANPVNQISGPFTDIDNEFYSMSYKGFFKASVTGDYQFMIDSDDASYLWIGSANETLTSLTGRVNVDNSVVSFPGIHPGSGGTCSTCQQTIHLDAGQTYPMLVYFGENQWGDFIDLQFKTPGGQFQSDGSGFYFNAPSSPGLIAEVFDGYFNDQIGFFRPNSFVVANLNKSASTVSQSSIDVDAANAIASNNIVTQEYYSYDGVAWGRWDLQNCSSINNCAVNGSILTIAPLTPISTSDIASLKGVLLNGLDNIMNYSQLYLTSYPINEVNSIDGGYLHTNGTSATINFTTGTMSLSIAGTDLSPNSGLGDYVATANNAKISDFMTKGIGLSGTCSGGGCSQNNLLNITGNARGGFIGPVVNQLPQGVVGTFGLTNGVNSEIGTFELR